MTGGIPKTNSYERIISLVNSDELNKILFNFFKTFTRKLNSEIKLRNFDGKVNNRSKRNTTVINEKKNLLIV